MAERLLKVYANSNPNFEFHVVEGGHHVHLNEPEKVAPLILNFLRKNFRRQVSVLWLVYIGEFVRENARDIAFITYRGN